MKNHGRTFIESFEKTIQDCSQKLGLDEEDEAEHVDPINFRPPSRIQNYNPATDDTEFNGYILNTLREEEEVEDVGRDENSFLKTRPVVSSTPFDGSNNKPFRDIKNTIRTNQATKSKVPLPSLKPITSETPNRANVPTAARKLSSEIRETAPSETVVPLLKVPSCNSSVLSNLENTTELSSAIDERNQTDKPSCIVIENELVGTQLIYAEESEIEIPKTVKTSTQLPLMTSTAAATSETPQENVTSTSETLKAAKGVRKTARILSSSSDNSESQHLTIDETEKNAPSEEDVDRMLSESIDEANRHLEQEDEVDMIGDDDEWEEIEDEIKDAFVNIDKVRPSSSTLAEFNKIFGAKSDNEDDNGENQTNDANSRETSKGTDDGPSTSAQSTKVTARVEENSSSCDDVPLAVLVPSNVTSRKARKRKSAESLKIRMALPKRKRRSKSTESASTAEDFNTSSISASTAIATTKPKAKKRKSPVLKTARLSGEIKKSNKRRSAGKSKTSKRTLRSSDDGASQSSADPPPRRSSGRKSIRPQRSCKPVNMKEPSLNKKMRR